MSSILKYTFNYPKKKSCLSLGFFLSLSKLIKNKNKGYKYEANKRKHNYRSNIQKR
jgi:hypothetical protein